MKSRNKWIPGLAALAVMLLALYAGVQWIDQDERLYFERGQAVSRALDLWAEGLQQQDFSILQQLYSTEFEGLPLGLLGPPLSHEEHGLLIYTFLGRSSVVGREEALQEWRQYLQEFALIEEVRANIVDLQQWQDESALEASVRLTLVGQRGEPEVTVVDRMMLSLEAVPAPARPQFAAMRLISGERLTGQPLFEDASQQSRLDIRTAEGDSADGSESSQPSNLAASASAPVDDRYAMARYWGHGISAGDYDGDAWIDLFLPGPAPRLMRNDGRGRFIDATRLAGLDSLGPARLGHLIDYDNDGQRDLFVVLGPASDHDDAPPGTLGGRLLRNNGDGTFADITGRAGLSSGCCVTAAAWADFDNDGNLDLYLGRHLDPSSQSPSSFYSRNGQPNQLWRNNGDGTFREMAAEAEVDDTGLCLGVAWGDFDSDNRPDLWVVNEYGRSLLYRNLGQNLFEDVSGQVGAAAFGSGHSAAIADYDDDGRLDLFAGRVLSHQAWYGEGPTPAAFMLSALRQRPFSQAVAMIFEAVSEAGLQTADVFTPRRKGGLLISSRTSEDDSAPGQRFVDATYTARLLESAWIWSGSFADLDADGDQDLVLTAGGRPGASGTRIELDFLHAAVHRQEDFSSGLLFDPRHWDGRSWFGDDRSLLLLNDGEGTFREVGIPAGAALQGLTRGLALADFNGDGRLDLALSRPAAPAVLLTNRIPLQSRTEGDSPEAQERTNHWIILHLVGKDSSRDAVGARVALTAGGRTQIREVQAGSGYASQNMLWLHFGLGSNQQIDEIRVRWPRSGRLQILNPLAVDRRYRITEGDPQAEIY